jgi:hypothetical protein
MACCEHSNYSLGSIKVMDFLQHVIDLSKRSSLVSILYILRIQNCMICGNYYNACSAVYLQGSELLAGILVSFTMRPSLFR